MCAMRAQYYAIAFILVFAICLTSAKADVTALAAGQPGTSDAKAVSQQKPSAPISAESLLQKIDEAFRGTSAVCFSPWCYMVCP